MALVDDFQKATKEVQELPQKPNNDELLELYSLFKQATEGDAHGSKPSRLNFVAHAKYQAWEKLKGVEKEEAMNRYISTVHGLMKKYN